MAFHNLLPEPLPPWISKLLGLGLKFIPVPSQTTTFAKIQENTIPRLDRTIDLKAWFNDKPMSDDDDSFNPKMFIPSDWTVPLRHPTLTARTDEFDKSLEMLFPIKPKRALKNLPFSSLVALRQLREDKQILVVQCDKNLGPATIRLDDYIHLAFRDHLSDSTTYEEIAMDRHDAIMQDLTYKVREWRTSIFHRYRFTKDEKHYFERAYDKSNAFDSLPCFYTTLKVHKAPLKSRPIVSYSGSILQPIGLWLDKHLQEVAQIQRSYFKSSFELKDEIVKLRLPNTARLHTSDATSMYTNIPTDDALDRISAYLETHRFGRFKHLPISPMIAALRLIMKNSYFTFGDTIWLQKDGTAMGAPPAPTYATLYYAIHEDTFLDKYNGKLLFYRRFIDDVYYIWNFDSPESNDLHDVFRSDMNDYGLEWTYLPNELGSSVIFMDLRIMFDGTHIETTLYEKPLNLFLYLPPHSAHPPGVIKGLIHGLVYRTYRLCTSAADISEKVDLYFLRLRARGWTRATLTPIFEDAQRRATTRRASDFTTPPPDPNDSEEALDAIRIHLPFHPEDPPAREVNDLWERTVLKPPGQPPIREVNGFKGQGKLRIGRLTVAYHRAPNLGNLLSYRRIEKKTTTPVSAYIGTDHRSAVSKLRING
jgi:hypothetical protein